MKARATAEGRFIQSTVALGDIAGLALLGYPLHPPGKPERLRAAHLPQVRAPMLFVQGSRDTFGTPDELAPIVRSLPHGSRLFVVEGGDHSLVVRREPLATTIARAADEVADFSRLTAKGDNEKSE